MASTLVRLLVKVAIFGCSLDFRDKVRSIFPRLELERCIRSQAVGLTKENLMFQSTIAELRSVYYGSQSDQVDKDSMRLRTQANDAYIRELNERLSFFELTLLVENKKSKNREEESKKKKKGALLPKEEEQENEIQVDRNGVRKKREMNEKERNQYIREVFF